MKKKISNYKIIKRPWKIKAHRTNQLASEQDYPIETARHPYNGGKAGNHSTPTPHMNHMASLEAMLM